MTSKNKKVALEKMNDIYDPRNSGEFDEPYITHKSLSQDCLQQSIEDYGVKVGKKELVIDDVEEQEDIENDPEEQETNEPEDTFGVDQNFGEEEQKSAEEIGRIYELKKIYSRLVSAESYLSISDDEILLKLRNFISQAIDLFKTVIHNIDQFKEKIDDIITIFYEFLENVYIILKRYYKIKVKE